MQEQLEEMRRCKRSSLFLSYFEWFDLDRGIFVSLFKTDKTTFYEKTMPKSGEMVFDLDPKPENNTYLQKNISALVDNNFGFFDFFWFMKKKDSYSFEEILHWMRSLYYSNTEDELTYYYGVATLKSTADPDFESKVYVKSEPLPQETINVIPIFLGYDGEKYVVLATKRKSNPVRVTLPNSVELDVLSVGKFGKTLMGEHLEEGEKKRMEDARAIFQANKERVTKMSQKHISSVVRTCFEEGGFTLSAQECNIYYVHTDNAPARDDRYWTYYSKCGENFGYSRDSTSDTVAVIMHGSVPETLPEPNDLAECETPVIMNVNHVFDLLEKKELAFAFPAHMAQLSIAQFPFPMPKFDCEKKFAELPFDPELSVRVVLADGNSLRRDFAFNRKRLNVSLNSNKKVFRVLGYF